MPKPAPSAAGELHHSHRAVVARMNRAAGQIRTVVAMIEAGRPCLDIAQQMQAAEMALGAAKRMLVQDHIDHCLDEAMRRRGPERRAAVAEFKDIAKYL